MREIEARNVVLKATSINPSIFAERWLLRHDIVAEDEFEEGAIFTPLAAQVPARDFQLVVLPEMLQFAVKASAADPAALVRDRVGRIVETLPHVPYSAMGLNIHWRVEPSPGVDFGAEVRRMFAPPAAGLRSFFTEEDCRFGGYMSKDVLGVRLKLDVKPVTSQVGDAEREALKYQFNFHRSLQEEDAVAAIVETLAQWPEAERLSEEIVLTSTGWCE